MPYKFARKYKPKGRKGKSNYGRRSWKRIARRSTKQVKRLQNNVWTAETLDNTAAASLNYAMGAIGQGTDYYQRVGSEVYSLGFDVSLIIEGSSSQNNTNYRIDFICDREPATQPATWTDVYNNQGTTDTDKLNAVLAPEKRRRFSILKTIRGCLKGYLFSTTGPTVTPDVKSYKFHLKTHKKMRFGGTAVSNPDYGCAFYAIGWSDLTANTPKVYMQTEHQFYDN